MKHRLDFAWVAHRLDQSNPQNLGEFDVVHRPHRKRRSAHFHCSADGKHVINRGTMRVSGPATWTCRS